jgi:hypothetical protein
MDVVLAVSRLAQGTFFVFCFFVVVVLLEQRLETDSEFKMKRFKQYQTLYRAT